MPIGPAWVVMLLLSKILPLSAFAGLAAACFLAQSPPGFGAGLASAAPAGNGVDVPLVRVPVSGLSFGEGPSPKMTNPESGDPAAASRGQTYFSQFNCVGCHAPNGAGGMGPALSNSHFIYGSEPAQIYLSILQGRPRGMPAWTKLPEPVIWDLVAYIKSISKDPLDPWQHTVSVQSFDTEQVPAEATKTTDPWSYNESFSFGRSPYQHGNLAFPTVGPRR